MKTILCGMMLFLLSMLASAQDKYYSYVDTTARWYFKKTVRVGGEYNIMDQTQLDTYEKYRFIKDTMIQDTQFYRSVVEFKGYEYHMALSYFAESDSIVYIFNAVDFKHARSLDTLFNFKGPGNGSVEFNGLNLTKYSNNCYEAIGWNSVTNNNIDVFPYVGDLRWLYFNGKKPLWSINDYHLVDQEFLCYERDGKIIYQNPDYESCWPEAVSARMTDKEEKQFVPNPLRQTALIATEGYAELRIFTGAGREVLRASLDDAELYTIDPMMFASGMYHIVLYRADGIADTQTVQIVR